MIKIQIKSRFSWSVLFEYEKNNNTIKDTLIEAVKARADLRGAYLRGANNITGTERYRQCMQNLLYVMSYLKAEVPALKEKLLAGKVNWTQYEWECCCLIWSLGNGSDEWVEQVCEIIPFYKKWLHNLWEQWFYQIREWDTNTVFVQEAIKCCDMIINQW